MKIIVKGYLASCVSGAEEVESLKRLRNKENRIVFNSFRLSWIKGLDKAIIPGGIGETWNKIQSQMLQGDFKVWQSYRKTYQRSGYSAIFFFCNRCG
ncbi:MAG: hypothetical protein GXO81_03230 [Chlorobi bacterium]|nr:hypothetical protein [Chlorobiota bacterium]